MMIESGWAWSASVTAAGPPIASAAVPRRRASFRHRCAASSSADAGCSTHFSSFDDTQTHSPLSRSLSVTHARIASAQTRGFLVRLGTDTFAVERHRDVRRHDEQVSVVRHTPSTTILMYSLTLNADGTTKSYEEGVFLANGSPAPDDSRRRRAGHG